MLLPTQEIKNTLAKIDILVTKLTLIADMGLEIITVFRNAVKR